MSCWERPRSLCLQNGICEPELIAVGHEAFHIDARLPLDPSIWILGSLPQKSPPPPSVRY